jgi:uncharacterized protein with ParB-like and HNH nuclease domain
MKAIDRPFTSIVNGTTLFVIPVFQRDYAWSEAQCAQLWNDILHAATTGSDRGHFLGSIVYVATGDTAAGFTRWLLIDGQQRLTTLTLLLIALRDHIQETNWHGLEDDPTPKRIDAYFLRNVQENGAREQKLVLRRHDQETRWMSGSALRRLEEALARFGKPGGLHGNTHAPLVGGQKETSFAPG